MTFETPFHNMCASHTGILYRLGQTISSVYFDDVKLESCPNAIVTTDGKFKYCGVSDGQAIYRQEEMS